MSCLWLLVALSGASALGAGHPAVKTNIGVRASIGHLRNAQPRSLRKARAFDAQQQQMDKKLAGEASFFWECVDRWRRGEDFEGCSGAPVTTRGAAELFESQPSSSIDFEQYDSIPVKRSGVAAASESLIPTLEDFAELTARRQLPPFAERNLLDERRMRYSKPTPIQKHTIPLALAGLDVLASAQTGSGKTVAFLLPLIAAVSREGGSAASVAAAQAQRNDAWRRERKREGPLDTGKGRLSAASERALARLGTPAQPAALVLAPTRELALQIELECAKLTCDAPPPPSGARKWCACAYGGANARPQLENLAGGVEILIATPGRLVDFVHRDLVSLAACRFLVLDEADRMLDMGFEPQIKRIVEQHDLPPPDARQTLLFSATFAPQIEAVARRYLREQHVRVAVGRVGSSVKSINQTLVRADKGDKRAKLALLTGGMLDASERTIVFVQKKHIATWLKQQLARDGYRVADIHGDRSQGQRETALRAFRGGDVDVLIATDVASRGIDVPEVAHVVQFDLPVSRDSFDDYVHRIGRTGRAGRAGRATAIFVPGDEPKIGNGALWPDLCKVLQENDQHIPPWFAALGPKPVASARRKGASPNRRARRAAAAAAAGRGPSVSREGGR